MITRFSIGGEEAPAVKGPAAGDDLQRTLETLSGASVWVFKNRETEETFMWCTGCEARKERGYGWSDKTNEDAARHANACRVSAVVKP